MKRITNMKWLMVIALSFIIYPLSFSSVAAQEKLLVADAFEFCVRMDYTADGQNGMSRNFPARFGVEGWDNHMSLALVMTADIEQAAKQGQPYKPTAEVEAAAHPALPVVYQHTDEGYQNVTFFSSDQQYAYVLYFAPEQQRSWLLVSRIGGGIIQPLYQLSNDVTMLDDTQLTADLLIHYPELDSANLDAFISLTGRLASGQYHGINYIEP